MSMEIAIGLDVYGTLVDPLGMTEHLRTLVGDRAEDIAAGWRAKQLEYTFRRTAMGVYENFDVCTAQALHFVLSSVQISLTNDEQRLLLDRYQKLEAYPEAAAALMQLKEKGFSLVAFSNGVAATLRRLLDNAALMPFLDGIVSVDELKTFKPDRRVYAYLADGLKRANSDTWLISSNPFDVIGAKSAGLKAAWIRRNSSAVFDPWGIEPDLIVADLIELATKFA
jgi:2-haloacid dehalogenase